jgi:nitroimidazol reductase NimA-like FMN-containing flavoprotein (pyridoxamine 5'-phosphate oxidase superfamily)
MIQMSPIEIEAFLDQSLIGRLSLASPDGRPYTIPLPFCWLDGALYLRIPLTGRKGEILRANDQVCFEVDRFSSTLDDYASVIVEGRLVPVTDVEEKTRVKATNHEKYERLRQGYRPGHGRKTATAELPMRKIVVTQVSGRAKTASPVLA